MAVLEDLMAWYQAQCDGDWEHTYGIHIGTLDNPGWSVKIDLADTILEEEPFTERRSGDPEGPSWLVCHVERHHHQFIGMGDPTRLQEILGIFLEWAKNRTGWLEVPDEETLQARDDRQLWRLLTSDLSEKICIVGGCIERCTRNSIRCPRHHWESNFGCRPPLG